MLHFLFHRLWQSALVMLVMSFVVYALIGLMPGDPIDLMITADPKITAMVTKIALAQMRQTPAEAQAYVEAAIKKFSK